MDKNIGFIGCGNMAKAIIGGIVNSKLVSPENIMASNPSNKSLDFVRDKYEVRTTNNNLEVADFSDILFLAVKPNKYKEIICQIKNSVKKDVIIVSIAAGITIETMESYFERDIKIVRTMPNTPALVGEAMSAICGNYIVSSEELATIVKIFESFGKTEIIEERLMDAIPSISGSSPAYVYMFIEALADGGVLRGIPREKAYKLAAQAVLGAAKMVLETGKHPGELKDSVCSPGGTTIEAIYTLEKNNFRGTIISAMESCTEKAIKMSNSNK
ncbi:pyrroline-5-carboxylate reductase [Fervidicella metallireducens AeB]|uniref:Pyrroline-5-carboxylate reductase n=1 Tax=Fervidicella metallireducens AeB TaxID=1403537 RepID=A0A017RXG6_9CLOT|nr:pyrroline-5-carboxylate reductase [Fervidicella metallireducens]EYE89387.1 pyrroline-5-carboxylate reductase [Fervidicella metallireducens AeB]